MKPYGYVIGVETSHKDGNIEDLFKNEDHANNECVKFNDYYKDEEDNEYKSPLKLYTQFDLEALQLELTSLKRKHLELSRVFEERGKQIERLDLALIRAKFK